MTTYKKLFFLLMLTCIAFSFKKEVITFKKLDFNTTCKALDSLCDWQESYAVRSKIEFVNISDNKNDFALSIINTANGVGFVEQSYTLQNNSEETIFNFSAQIKTEHLKGKGAGINIGIYDAENNMIQNIDLGHNDYNYVKNTTDWVTKSLKTIVSREAKTIKIGVISYGTGRAYFDNAEVNFSKIGNQKPSALAKEYVDKAADSIMKHSLFKSRIAIEPIKEKAYAIAGNARTAEDTYLAIEYMLEAINDKHAFFMPAIERKAWEGNSIENKVDFSSIRYSSSEIKENYGYIAIPGFAGVDYQLRVAFADTIQKQIKELYSKNIQGFIVDLRQNDGGNMDPILAGLEPLYSADTTGFLIDVHGKKEYWGRNEAFKNALGTSYTQPTIKTKINNWLPIAVLYGNATGSSGEVIIISFIGNAKTKSFGQQSYGLTTGNGEYKLPDDSYMFLSSTYMADRNGKIYKSNVIPDVVIAENEESKDKTLETAINWLKTQ